MTHAQRESWDQVQEELGPRQAEVLALISSHPAGLTAWEIAERTGRLVHAVRPRLTELCKRGLIREAGLRFYSPTQRNETVWMPAVALLPPVFGVADDGQHFFI